MGLIPNIDVEKLKDGLNSDKNKNKLTRVIAGIAFIVIVWAVSMEVIKAVGMVGVAMGGIGLTLSSTIPRPILLWWQRQSAIVEFTVAILLGVMVGTGAGGWAVLSFTAVALFVTSLIKMLNMAHSFSYGDTLYERLCKSTTPLWPTNIELWWFFGGAKGPLSKEWKWEKERVGPMGLRFLVVSITHLLKKDHEYNFFAGVDRGRPSKLKKWINQERYFYDLEVYEGEVQRAEKKEAMRQEKIVLLGEYTLAMELPPTLGNINLVAEIAKRLIKLDTEQKEEN